MYLGNIAPWEQYPKHLRFCDVMNPLQAVINFFSAGWPKDHIKDLKEWRYYVLNDKCYKDRHGSGHIAFIYEENVRLIEAMHLLLLKNKDRWPVLEEVREEQIEQEKKDWVYFPKNLSQKELANPYRTIGKCFKKTSPQEYREYLHEWLETALYNHAADETIPASEIITVYDSIRKLYSAAWLIHQRETTQALTHQTWGQGAARNEEPEKGIDAEELAPLKDINPELNEAEKSGLEEVTKLIVDRIPSVRFIYLVGTHDNPFTYYLVVLIGDKEKTPEHEIANKIEDNCRHLASVFAIVHKLSSVREAIAQGRRFFNNTLYKSIKIYAAAKIETPDPHAIDDQIWLERAEQIWNRWGMQGKGFMKGAVHYMDGGNYSLAVFSLHQAAESSLIAIIYTVLGYRLTSHNLLRMIRITLLFTDEIKKVLQLDTSEGEQLFSLLLNAYSESRYKSEFNPDEQSTKLLKIKVDLLLVKIEQVHQQFIKDKSTP